MRAVVMNITPTLWTATESFRTAARFEDVNAVERLVRSTGAFSEAEVAIARELVEESLSRGEEISGYRFLFAEGSSGLNGYTCLGPIAGTVNRYELYWIVVHPNIRRAKLGHRLLQASEEMVRTLGGVGLFVEVQRAANMQRHDVSMRRKAIASWPRCPIGTLMATAWLFSANDYNHERQTRGRWSNHQINGWKSAWAAKCVKAESQGQQELLLDELYNGHA